MLSAACILWSKSGNYDFFFFYTVKSRSEGVYSHQNLIYRLLYNPYISSNHVKSGLMRPCWIFHTPGKSRARIPTGTASVIHRHDVRFDVGFALSGNALQIQLMSLWHCVLDSLQVASLHLVLPHV